MSDYLTDEEQLARLKSWWDDNGTSTIVGLVLVIVGIVGWRWYDGYHQEQVAAASDLYEEFLASEGVARGTIAKTIANEAPDTAYHALALMHLARDAVTDGDYARADEYLQAAISAAPEPELADLARLRLARVQQQVDRSDDALKTLGAIRGEGFRSHVAELKGDIHLARGERLLAQESYRVALETETDQDQRPLLRMKVADTADATSATIAGQGIAGQGEGEPAEATQPVVAVPGAEDAVAEGIAVSEPAEALDPADAGQADGVSPGEVEAPDA